MTDHVSSIGEDSLDENKSDMNASGGKPKRRWLRTIVMLSVPVALIVGAYLYWESLQGKVSTDNAYIQMDKVSVSAEIPGKISTVAVKEGQEVKAGTLLFRIDPEPFRLEIASAEAAIAQAEANVSALSNSSDLSGAAIAAANEDIAFAEANFRRKDALFKRGFLTKTELDASRHAVSQAREGLNIAMAKQEEARAKLSEGSAVPGKNPLIAAAEARRAQAMLNLRRSEIFAPISGRVTQTDRLLPGQQIIQGLPVVTLVAANTAYIEANFKETDLDEMAIGQRAVIKIDAYPGLELKGHVRSIGAGTGSEFSLLPAQNSSGNWVKVTQRVPVRIAIDEKSPRNLIAGLSCRITVYVGKK